jgi:hypothetical protein
MKRAFLFSWWFLLLGHHPVVVGPFFVQSECEAIQGELPDAARFTTCWDDTEQPIVRR